MTSLKAWMVPRGGKTSEFPSQIKSHSDLMGMSPAVISNSNGSVSAFRMARQWPRAKHKALQMNETTLVARDGGSHPKIKTRVLHENIQTTMVVKTTKFQLATCGIGGRAVKTGSCSEVVTLVLRWARGELEPWRFATSRLGAGRPYSPDAGPFGVTQTGPGSTRCRN